MTTSIFAERGDKTAIETGAVLQPKFDGDGLIAAVVTDHATGDVLMVGYMNAEALRRVFAGERGPPRDAILLNAALALEVVDLNDPPAIALPPVVDDSVFV